MVNRASGWATALRGVVCRLWLAWLTTAVAIAQTGPAAAPKQPRLGFVGLHGGVFAVLQDAAPARGVVVHYLDDEPLARGEIDLAAFDALCVQHLRTDVRAALAAQVLQARQRQPELRLFALSGAPALDGPDAAAVPIEVDARLQAYYGASQENLRRLLDCLAVRCGGAPRDVPPPQVQRALGLWHPAQPTLQDAAEFTAWLHGRGGDFARRPRVAVAVHSIHLELQQPAVVAALIAALEATGMCAFGIVDTSEGLASQRQRYEQLLAEMAPAAVVHTCHSTDRLELRLSLDVPHLSSLFFRKKSIAEWAASQDGLEPNEVVFQVAGQELLGAIEPIACAGTTLGGGSSEAFTPLAERVAHLAARTQRWVALRTKPNADKRIALVYWDRGMHKADLMRGSATGMHLNAPRSLLAVAERLRAEGYRLPGLPTGETELVAELLRGGRQIARHDHDGLRELLATGAPELLPVATYERWLAEHVPSAARDELYARWGPPPGDIMTTTTADGTRCFVIPRLDHGGLVLLPQPLRGEAHDDRAIHDKLTCPPHHYVATYLWLQHGLGADAVVHFGTHGSEFALPGKSVGLAETDWPDLVLGSLPNIAPWIVENLGEAMAAKRRAYAVLVGHLPPPAVDGGLADELARLHDELDRFVVLPAGALKERFRRQIGRQVEEQRLDRDLALVAGPDGQFDDPSLQRVDDHLHELAESTTPVSLHTFGQPPAPELLIPHLVSCLRAGFRERLAALGAGGGHADHVRPAAERLLALHLRDGLAAEAAFAAAGIDLRGAEIPDSLQQDLELARSLWLGYAATGNELDGLVRALAGRFAVPGPGRGPMRNPGVLPTGRNLYALNPDEVPSRASWELGRQLADDLLAAHRRQHGRELTKVAFSLSSFATFQDYGVMEAQVLWLLGCEPIWDAKNLVREFRIVPRAELGRPRVDVFLSALSYYRDHLPSRMELLDRAVRAVAACDEADNAVRQFTAAAQARLTAEGLDSDVAARLASARIFGHAPGLSSSASYYYLVERSGDWDTRDELMDLYLDQASHVYTAGAWGEPARAAYAAAAQGTEVVLRTWFDHTTSPLSNKYQWYTGGSLALAIEKVTGKRPDYTFVDVRDDRAPRLVAAEAALLADVRVRLFNRKWLQGMQQEGYAGADQMKVLVSNLFGWETMRQGSVPKDVWDDVVAVLLEDEKQLGLREFFATHNPHAEQGIAELLLEAARKGHWQADAATLRRVATRYLEHRERHGDAGGILQAGAGKVLAFAARVLTNEPAAATSTVATTDASGDAPVAAAPTATPPPPADATANTTTAPTVAVEGTRLVPAAAPDRAPSIAWIATLAGLFFCLGALRRRPL